MKWINVDENYLDYLRSFEKKYQKPIMVPINISHSLVYFLRLILYTI